MFLRRGVRSERRAPLHGRPLDARPGRPARTGARPRRLPRRVPGPRRPGLAGRLLPPPDRPRSEAEYHGTLWHVLQFLHVHDPGPWPADIPTDPDDPCWEFRFGGEPIFPTSRTPFYEERKSRYSPVRLEVTFQPRALFEEPDATADTESGQRAPEIIQNRLGGYDGVCPHADLGDWGVEGDREWRQYMLSEDPVQAPDCPITVTREHPKSDFLAGDCARDWSRPVEGPR